MKIERLISWFDRETEELTGEYNIDHIAFELLKNIIKPSNEDPLMYNPYTLTREQSIALNKEVNFIFDFDKYIYQIDCFQIEP